MLLPPFHTPTPPSVQILCLRFRVLTFKYDLTEAFELYSSRKISTAAIQRSLVDSFSNPLSSLLQIFPRLCPDHLFYSLSPFDFRRKEESVWTCCYSIFAPSSPIPRYIKLQTHYFNREWETRFTEKFLRRKNPMKSISKRKGGMKERSEKYSIERETRWNSFDRIKRSWIRSSQSLNEGVAHV